MQTEDLSVDQCRKWKVVKEISKEIPHLRVSILPQALVIESVNLSDLSGFVIAAKNCYPISVSNLKKEFKFSNIH
jgi:hypothetical protein